MLSRVIQRTIEVLYSANKQWRAIQVQFPKHENKVIRQMVLLQAQAKYQDQRQNSHYCVHTFL